MERACELGDRLACDELEWEGPPPVPVQGGSSDRAHAPLLQPSKAELAWMLLPLLLLAVATRLWSRRRRGGPPQGGAGGGAALDHLRSRRLAALSPQDHSAPGRTGHNNNMQQQVQQPAGPSQPKQHHAGGEASPAASALPPHPAAAGNAARSPHGSPDPSRRGATAAATTAGSSLLAAADTAISSLLVLPFSLMQHAKHLRAGAAGRGSAGRVTAQAVAPAAVTGPATPQAALVSPAGGGKQAGGTPGGQVYGLGIGEAESEEEEWGLQEESELTQACLRNLQRSAEFKAYLKARGLTAADVSATASRLRLYRRLRALDPAAFWQLLRPSSRTVFDSRPPSRLLLASDYMLSSVINLGAAAAAYRLGWGAALAPLPPAARAAAAAGVLWVAAVAHWAHARPTAGGLFGLWYEEERWGHAAPAWRCVAAGLIETAYIILSAGLGLLISLFLRCLSPQRQSVGEMLAAVHAVQETKALASWGEESTGEQERTAAGRSGRRYRSP